MDAIITPNKWEDIHRKNDWGRWPEISLVKFMSRYPKKERGDIHVLEVGCGAGNNMWMLAREGFVAYGIDSSSVATHKAREWLVAEGYGRESLRVWADSVLDMPYEADTFDCVVDASCLYCVSYQEIDAALWQIRRVLKDGGAFYSRTFREYPPNDRGIKARVMDEDGIRETYGRHFTVDAIVPYRAGGVKEWVILCRK